MLENFIYAKKKALFETALNNGEVLDESIVFIEDTKLIWNHGTYFDCSTTNFEEILSNYVDKTTGQTISGLKTFTNHIVLNNQSRIRSNIDPGELKVTRTNDDKGFIIRVNKDSTDSILPLEILSTNGTASYQYNFPKKSGTVALGVKKNGQVINANLTDGLIDLGDGYVKTTYANLKNLRDNSRLIPGQKYRITDYKTTVLELSGISVANHQFDIIVDALTPNTLSETAHVTNSIHSIGEKTQDLFSWDMNPGNWQSANVSEIKALTDLSIYVLLGTRTINQAGIVKVRFTAVQEDPETNDICIGADLVKDGTVVSKDYHIGRINYHPWQEENNIYYLPVTEAGSYVIRYYVVGASSNFETNLKVTVEVYDGIDYFANNNLNSWEIKYCLDSDTNRFQWANIDPAINKGVIYYMKDDKGNECPYDFKNILFDNFYTFSYTVNGVLYDGSVKYQCYNNRILPTHNQDGVIKLNKNVFKNTSATSLCCFNIFGLDCEGNTFGDSCASNTFGNYCKENTFGNSCLYNNFEDFCLSNTFGNYCQSNKFGVLCQSNKFGSYIIRITFGRQCINCKFVDGYDNILEACRMIELGDLCNGINIKSFSAPSYSSNSWLQNIKIANGLSGDIGVMTLNDKQTLHIIRNSSNSITQLYEDSWSDSISIIEENLNNKQDKLVSGENIKTINNQSILGSGNITIEGGGSVTIVNNLTDGGANKALSAEMGKNLNNTIKRLGETVRDTSVELNRVNGDISNLSFTMATKEDLLEYAKSADVITAEPAEGDSEEVEDYVLMKSDIAHIIPYVVEQADSVATIQPNVLNVWGEVASLDITLAEPTDNTIVNEYMVQFTSGETATTLTLPNTIKWMAAPNIQPNKTYQLSVINNLGVIGEFNHE